MRRGCVHRGCSNNRRRGFLPRSHRTASRFSQRARSLCAIAQEIEADLCRWLCQRVRRRWQVAIDPKRSSRTPNSATAEALQPRGNVQCWLSEQSPISSGGRAQRHQSRLPPVIVLNNVTMIGAEPQRDPLHEYPYFSIFRDKADSPTHASPSGLLSAVVSRA